jgi:hypothetical protein
MTCVENNDDVRIKSTGMALIFIVGSKDGTTDNSEVGFADKKELVGADDVELRLYDGTNDGA